MNVLRRLIGVDILSVKGVKAITYITTCPDKQVVLSLLCSQLNTVSEGAWNFASVFLQNLDAQIQPG